MAGVVNAKPMINAILQQCERGKCLSHVETIRKSDMEYLLFWVRSQLRRLIIFNKWQEEWQRKQYTIGQRRLDGSIPYIVVGTMLIQLVGSNPTPANF